jgi:hypothetical protein
MMTDGINIYYFPAVALIVALLFTWGVKRNYRGFFKSFLASTGLKKSYASDRMFENLRVPAFKTCPNCEGQLPLSALLCGACDFNFLAGSLCRGNKMLPAPEAFDDHASRPETAAAGI